MKRFLLVTNLFPRPDLPRCGVFNAHFASALASELAGGQRLEVRCRRSGGGSQQDMSTSLSPQSTLHSPLSTFHVLVPVPEWRLWRHGEIRAWIPPPESFSLLSPPITVHYVPVFYIPIIGRSLSHLFYRSAFLRYQSLFSECDAVLGSWLYPDCVAVAAAAKWAGKPFWARLHGTDRFHLDARFRGAMCRRALLAARGVFVNAEFMRQELIEQGVEAGKIHVVRNGVDRERFCPRDREEALTALARQTADLRSLTSALHPPTTVLWVGNLVPIKGPDIALRAFHDFLHSTFHVPRSTSHLQLILVGEGPMRSKLELLALELGIADQVKFLGSISQNEVAEWMRKSECLLLSSKSEAMPNVVVEALTSGIPIVATDVGDVSTVIRDGLNGRVVAANTDTTADELAKALNDVLGRKWDAVMLRESVADFDWQRNAEMVLSIISSKMAE